ncbi:MAG: hypothetical protein IT203_04910 [Fimbriimonadaceae bacterium]|nr:hypothetical protein [Fimbriimonadaceae bacterium]
MRKSLLPFLSVAMSLLVAATLGLAAVTKVETIGQVEKVIYKARMFPGWMVPWVSLAIPVVEGLVVLAILVPKTRKHGLTAASVLFSAFAAYNVWRIMRNIAVPCACFGTLLKTTPQNSLAVSLLALVLSQAARTRR